MNPFAVLGLAPSFDVDATALEKTHRDLSKALHPDKFASSTPGERREALARAVEVNEAYRVVRDPIRRAEALFGLAGIEVGETKEPKPSPTFLMDVLEQREALAEAKAEKNRARVESLADEMRGRQALAQDALSAAFRGGNVHNVHRANALAEALPRLGELRFYKRFLEEVDAIQDEWDGI